MSMNDGEASSKALDEPKNASVYDFLYYDKQRVGSFLAQFDDSGHLQRVTQSENASKGTRRGFKIGATGTVMGTGGGLHFERSPGEHGSEAIERIYDPLWSNALTLLDYLGSANLMHRDVTAARLGQFVLASGSLSVLNPTTLPKLWESPHIKSQAVITAVNGQKLIWNANPLNAALSSKDKAVAERAFLKNVEVNTRATMEILPYFPHSAQCTIKGDNFSLWSSLATDGMVGAVSDLSLKHGTEIPGVWHLLGIIDAQPDAIPAQVEIPYTGVPSHFETMIKNISNLARTALGRPPNAYGATALLLFREVSTGDN